MRNMENKLRFSDKIVLFPLWLITLLPLRVLYLLSDFIFLILFYLVRYRREVVYNNLKNSFPEKTESELKGMLRRFYRYLCDYFIESVYILHLSKKECDKRYKYKNPEVLHDLCARNKNLVIAMSHFGNWEWSMNLPVHFPYQVYGIYKPLSNKVFDRLFIALRGKYGVIPTPMKHTLRKINTSQQAKETFALLMVSDQRPGMEDLNYWTPFMNQEAPIITGMDKLARRYDLTVVFYNMKRVRRGYYEINFELLEEQAAKTDKYSICEKYIRSVESMITHQPEYYLWSHKRWKYNPVEFKPKGIA